MALFDIKNLSFTYPESAEKALSDISLSINQGELVTLLGATGSGKSTLLRMLKPELSLVGKKEGKILFDGKDISSLSTAQSASDIGYVAQNPDEQLVTDKVWQELSFTLENLGAEQNLIARRVAETSSYFDISSWYNLPTSTLSGGQKQLLNLAAVMTADPKVLILDEPTSQLDPISSARFIDTLRRLNTQTGLTVIICEHRAEELFSISDRVIILEEGRIVADDSPESVAAQLSSDSVYQAYLPASARIFTALGEVGTPPLSIRDGQRYIETKLNKIRSFSAEISEKIEENNKKSTKSGEKSYFSVDTKNQIFSPSDAVFSEKTGLAKHQNLSQSVTATNVTKPRVALEIRNVYFRYDRRDRDILSDFSLTVYEGEIFALLGDNGAGKSTAVAVATGLKRPYSGSVSLFQKPLSAYKNGSLYKGNISLLPQDIESVFISETVAEELKGCEAVASALPYDLSHLYSRHPYDISGGERQLVALCKALSTNPRLIIMDEPSKGLDPVSKQRLKEVIFSLKSRGVTVILVSHDIEFAAECADRCALFSQGAVSAVDPTERFMTENRFYTTAASRITRRKFDGAYTVDKAVRLIKLNAEVTK